MIIEMILEIKTHFLLITLKVNLLLYSFSYDSFFLFLSISGSNRTLLQIFSSPYATHSSWNSKCMEKAERQTGSQKTHSFFSTVW